MEICSRRIVTKAAAETELVTSLSNLALWSTWTIMTYHGPWFTDVHGCWLLMLLVHQPTQSTVQPWPSESQLCTRKVHVSKVKVTCKLALALAPAASSAAPQRSRVHGTGQSGREGVHLGRQRSCDVNEVTIGRLCPLIFHLDLVLYRFGSWISPWTTPYQQLQQPLADQVAQVDLRA